MKRFFATICIALAALMTPSCLDYDTPNRTDIVPVTFRLDGLQSGPLTKATDAELQAAVAAASTFATPTITLTSSVDPTKVYTATPGTQTYLPVGDYMATANIEGQQTTVCAFGTVFSTPSMAVQQSVSVKDTTHTVTLTAQPRCFALLLDRSTTQYYRLEHGYETNGLNIFPDGEGIAVVFIVPNGTQSTTRTATIWARSAVSSNDKYYPVSWLDANSGTHLAVGNWYCFPGMASGVDATIEMTYGTFARGYSGN